MAVTGALRSLAFMTIAFASLGCQAIGNPEAPDHLGEFRSEASSHERAIFQDAQTTSGSMEAYRDYIEFLEKALAAASSGLEAELSDSERKAFNNSQAAWEAYRQSEKSFVSSVWTPQNFGSSSSFSRLAFYADIVRSRIEMLQKYRMQF